MKKNSIIKKHIKGGGIVNETDLERALNENLIFAVGFDVFSNEPVEKDNPLLKNKK